MRYGFPVHQGVCLGCGSAVLDGEHLESDERYSPCFGRPDAPSLVTTDKRRFVHIVREDGENTICGAHPAYYGGMFRRGLSDPHLIAITSEEAEDMHHCKRCFPKP